MNCKKKYPHRMTKDQALNALRLDLDEFVDKIPDREGTSKTTDELLQSAELYGEHAYGFTHLESMALKAIGFAHPRAKAEAEAIAYKIRLRLMRRCGMRISNEERSLAVDTR